MKLSSAEEDRAFHNLKNERKRMGIWRQIPRTHYTSKQRNYYEDKRTEREESRPHLFVYCYLRTEGDKGRSRNQNPGAK